MINASVIKPARCRARFSNRKKVRRHSFNRPISRSTMFPRRYAWQSKGTGRPGDSFSSEGISGRILRFSKHWSIRSARYEIALGAPQRHRPGPAAGPVSAPWHRGHAFWPGSDDYWLPLAAPSPGVCAPGGLTLVPGGPASAASGLALAAGARRRASRLRLPHRLAPAARS